MIRPYFASGNFSLTCPKCKKKFEVATHDLTGEKKDISCPRCHNILDVRFYLQSLEKDLH